MKAILDHQKALSRLFGWMGVICLWLIGMSVVFAGSAPIAQAFPISTISAPTVPKGELLIRTPIRLAQIEGDSAIWAAPLLASYGLLGDLTLTLRLLYLSKKIQGKRHPGSGTRSF